MSFLDELHANGWESDPAEPEKAEEARRFRIMAGLEEEPTEEAMPVSEPSTRRPLRSPKSAVPEVSERPEPERADFPAAN